MPSKSSSDPTGIIQSTQLRDLYNYWKLKAGNRELPARADIDPSEIPHLLPYLCLVDVVGEAEAFRYRLIGTKVVDLRGRDVTGRWVDDALYPKNFRDVATMMSSAIEARAPVVGRNRFWGSGKIWSKVEWLNLPLSTDGGRIDMLLMSFVEIASFDKVHEQFRGTPIEMEIESIKSLR
jgi:hypothetical protein